MILPIYVYGQPVLRKVAEDITPDYPNLKELIANMFETMVHADGVGLAAPQIGLPIRVVTITLDPLSEDYPEFKDFNKAYINPHILEVGGPQFGHIHSPFAEEWRSVRPPMPLHFVLTYPCLIMSSYLLVNLTV